MIVAPDIDAHVGRRTLLGLTTGLAASGLVGCSKNPSASEDVGYAEGDGSYTVIAPDKRKQAPTLTGKDLAGKPLTTDGRAGRILVLNVWGSWCPPCRKEAPDLVKAASRLKGKADFIGISTRDQSAEAADAFCREFGITWPNFFDPDGELLLALRDLPPKAIPSTLVIDGQGRIAARVLGATTAATLAGIVDDVAAGK